jgi:hypothetical protein
MVLALVLLLFLVGSCLCIIVLQSSISGLETSRVYENKTAEFYATDAGIEDARWIIKYNYLDTFLTSPGYKYYNFTDDWTYNTSELINGENVTITIENVWVPVDIPVPTETEARTIVEAEKLIITSANGSSGYNILITYFPEAGEVLDVDSIGIWLPRGFQYVPESSNLDDVADNVTVVPHAGNEAVIWNFSSSPAVHFDDLPGVDPDVSPRIARITFQLNSESSDYDPDTVAWITTSGVADIPFSWESDVKVYKATSRAGTTEIEAWMAKSETRLLSGGIAGDYIATGNSLMIDFDGDGETREKLLPESSANVSSIPIDATVRAAYLYWSGWKSGVLFFDTCENFTHWDNGDGWFIGGSSFNYKFKGHWDSAGDPDERTLTLKESVNLSGKSPGEVKVMWTYGESGSLEESGYYKDCLKYAFSSDNGSTWGEDIEVFCGDLGYGEKKFEESIPEEYLAENFSMRFYFEGFTDTDEYCSIDTITITTSDMIPDTSVAFKIDDDQVYFGSGGTPKEGDEEIIADWSESMENTFYGSKPEGYSYVCFKDVTALVKEFSAQAPAPAVNHPGNANYTVGNVAADIISPNYPYNESYLAYAGWSLIIIYTSSDTQGHSLYLYDTFMHNGGDEDIDFDSDNISGGTITRFVVPEQLAGEVNAAKITVFCGEGDDYLTGEYLAVNGDKLWDGINTTDNTADLPHNCWNGKSLGMTFDGVDIDTFYVTWESNTLEAGETTATVDIPTNGDAWNLIYIILAFRDETRTGGSLSYLINQ